MYDRSEPSEGRFMQYEKFATIYDRLMDDMPYDDWLSWVEGLWERFGKPKQVVDLGCGTGTLALKLSARGVRVYGVDLSAEMLAIARQKEEQAGNHESVIWLEQNMAELDLPHSIDAAYSFCDSLNYILDEEEIVQTFAAVYEHLNRNGIFSFDMLSEYQYEAYATEQPFVLNEEELAYIWQIEYDRHKKMIEHDLTFFTKVNEANCFERFDEHHAQRAYDPEWIISILRACGFHEVWWGADFRWDSSQEQASRYFFTALKL